MWLQHWLQGASLRQRVLSASMHDSNNSLA